MPLLLQYAERLGSAGAAGIGELHMAEKNETLTQLKFLDQSSELMGLQKMLTPHSHTTMLELLEHFGCDNKNKECLHSQFLEFFLRPSEKAHGLLDTFLRAVLEKGKFYRKGALVTDLDLERNLSETEVKRESSSERGIVDLKLWNDVRGFVLLIENKVHADEGHIQLERYWKDAEEDHPGFAIGGVFLTLTGRKPTTAPMHNYVPVSYCEVAELLDKCVDCRGAEGIDATLAREYALAIRRWFVEDPQQKSLAWRIHAKYPEAIAYLKDEISPSGQMIEHMKRLVKEREDEFEILNAPKLQLWFVPRRWNDVPQLRHAKTNEADGRLLIFWFDTEDKTFDLYFGSVPGASPDTAAKLISAVKEYATPSSVGLSLDQKPKPKWTHLWGRRFVEDEQVNKQGPDEVFNSIDECWQSFLDTDFPKIMSGIQAVVPLL
jgi:hypothetical protein